MAMVIFFIVYTLLIKAPKIGKSWGIGQAKTQKSALLANFSLFSASI
jgi:hypothetical protein